MKIGKHRNVVQLIGIITRGLSIVMEYCEYGCLLTHLRKETMFPVCSAKLCKNDDSPSSQGEINEMTGFAYHVARGLEFLFNGHVVHGDLAARNILLDKNKQAKIADFGHARFETDADSLMLENHTIVPACWMAPEVLIGTWTVSTCRSDIWSFAVLLWEIFTLGADPHEHFGIDVDGISTGALAEYLQAGYRLRPPILLPEQLKPIINSCWEFQPENRPSCQEIIASLAALLPPEFMEIYISCGEECSTKL
ncbi:fibroblast growth factor receptor-like [Paramacrobiotus metropolitanus]|uniref:fibroblast growth factor receptor-like n=1 Tax=Paramacrobiotus metropolitanus TaxID=2943436 RepID=UPI0024457EDF|nr:fibroblast growth factor receptor-like [Paramacrobiotus metropolitanus]